MVSRFHTLLIAGVNARCALCGRTEGGQKSFHTLLIAGVNARLVYLFEQKDNAGRFHTLLIAGVNARWKELEVFGEKPSFPYPSDCGCQCKVPSDTP